MINTQINIWKHGCNWNHSKNSYYNFIKRKQIVLGSTLFKWKVGDLVLITEGFKVKSIVKVNEKPTTITKNPDYKFLFDEYKVPFEDWVNYAEAEWYELPEDKVFEYKVQRGAAKVHKQDTKEMVFKLWNSRNEIDL
jgi:hypothetical protein